MTPPPDYGAPSAVLDFAPATLPSRTSWRPSWRRLVGTGGPGLLIAVGYIDPGNWATDLGGGSRYGYALLSMVFIANLVAMVVQALCVRLAIATGKSLAEQLASGLEFGWHGHHRQHDAQVAVRRCAR